MNSWREVLQMMMLDNAIKTTCIYCNVDIVLSKQQWNNLKASGATFYCINGHRVAYSKVDLLKEAQENIARLEGKIARLQDELIREQTCYRCCVAGCDYAVRTKASLRKHLDRDHGIRAVDPIAGKLPADAGPSAHNSDLSADVSAHNSDLDELLQRRRRHE